MDFHPTYMDYKTKIKDLIEKTKSTYRDIQIEKLLNNEYEVKKLPNELFIIEIKEWLSVTKNKKDFYDWFIVDVDVADYSDNIINRTEKDFKDYLSLLYSEYKDKDEFNIKDIINSLVLESLPILH